jgi:hypothetical protein
MFTAPGVLQGYNSQVLVDAKHQVILHAAACGTGQDYGHVAPRLEEAQKKTNALGLGEEDFAGKLWSAESNYHSAENLKAWVQGKLDASSPDPPLRPGIPRLPRKPTTSPPQSRS